MKMPESALTADIWVYTFKEGLLSAVAHDLRLGCTPPTLHFDGQKIRCHVDPNSLYVDGVVKRGHIDPSGLNERDKASIRNTIQREILSVSRYPDITFDGGFADPIASGALTIRGVTHDIKFGVTREGTSWSGQMEIRPSRWGIKPYKALMGAIKLQDRVVIKFSCMVHQ